MNVLCKYTGLCIMVLLQDIERFGLFLSTRNFSHSSDVHVYRCNLCYTSAIITNMNRGERKHFCLMC